MSREWRVQNGAVPHSQLPRLLDQLRDRIRLKHYSIRTEQVYIDWVRRFIHVPWEAASARSARDSLISASLSNAQ